MNFNEGEGELESRVWQIAALKVRLLLHAAELLSRTVKSYLILTSLEKQPTKVHVAGMVDWGKKANEGVFLLANQAVCLGTGSGGRG